MAREKTTEAPKSGADVVVPMSIPTFGGILLEILTIVVVPVLYCAGVELEQNFSSGDP